MPLLIFLGAVLGASALLRLAYGAGHLGVDAMWALQWGNDLASLSSLAPTNGTTPHPLSNVVGAVIDVVAGRDADLWLSAATYLGAGLLVVATGLLARRLAGWPAGAGAALIVATRPELLTSTATGALDVWAAALICTAVAVAIPGHDAGHDRDAAAARPTTAMWLLLAAGLLRPEAWALALAWWAWRAWAERAPHGGQLALALAAPLLWMLHDAVFTGDALFAIHQTDAAAGALRQVQGIATGFTADVQRAVRAVGSALRPPLLIALVAAGVAGVVLGRRQRFDGSRQAFAFVWATLLLFAALIVLQAATGTLIFSRFALLIAALAAALVTATAVRAAPTSWPAGWVAAGVGVVVAVASIGTLREARRSSQEYHAFSSAARAALRPGVPCALLASPRTGLSIYASRWTGLPLDQIIENQSTPLDPPATYANVDLAAAATLLRDPRVLPPVEVPGARILRTTPGWQITTTCR